MSGNRTITLTLADGATTTVPSLGLGTWRMGESQNLRSAEIDALKLGIDLGARLIDTAEMYGEGIAEEIVGTAAAGRRDALFIVSKVYPHNASRRGVVAACERSLQRLQTDRLDLYLLHWRGSHPLTETVRGFEDLITAGKIRSWGVSNFDQSDLDELANVAGGEAIAANQVLYNLEARGIEYDVMPSLAAARVPIMAYSPLGQGSLAKHRALVPIAAKHGATPAAIALAFTLRHPGVVTIPKATTPEHVTANWRALDITLDADDLAALDRAFPPPRRKMPLGVL